MKAYFVLGAAVLSANLLNAVGVSVDVGPGGAGVDVGTDGYYNDGYYDGYNDGVIWAGPGYYYGAWFGTEVEFNNYRRGYYRDQDGRRGGEGGGYHGGGGGGHRH